MHKHRITAFLAASAMAFAMTACSGEKYTVHVKNLTGAEISEIIAYPETVGISHENLLEENLPVDGEIGLTLGKFTEEELQSGFAVDVVNADDGSMGNFSMLMLSDGDTVSFYIDDWGLAVGVNMTDEEIEEQKARDHEDYLSMVEEEASAAAEEEASAAAEEEAAKAAEEEASAAAEEEAAKAAKEEASAAAEKEAAEAE